MSSLILIFLSGRRDTHDVVVSFISFLFSESFSCDCTSVVNRSNQKGNYIYRFGGSSENAQNQVRTDSGNVKKLGFAVAGSPTESGDFFSTSDL